MLLEKRDNKLLNFIEPIVGYLYSFSIRMLRRFHPEWQPRRWSNTEMRRWGPLFQGEVINVSGWDDRDKEGGYYSDYFPNKSSYVISNIGGARAATGAANEIYLDLTADLPQKLYKRFDVVFNHTTLEHIFDVLKAVANLCALSRDIVIIVVPFRQPVHFESGSFVDYWRFTPFALEKLFKINGFEVIYCSYNKNPLFNIYLFCIGSCNAEKWRSFLPQSARTTQTDFPGSFWQ
jgi:hypothetical protein